MIEMIKHAHSGLRWLVLIFAILAIVKAFMGMQKKSAFTNGDNKIGLFLTIVCDTQLLLGLALYFMGALGLKTIQNMGMGEVMKNSYARFFAVEHIFGMVIAIILFHIGRAKSKSAIDDYAKHKKAFMFYLIGLLIILATIPWPFRTGFEGNHWF